MSYSPGLGSSITNTRMRTPDNVSDFSGMCAVCSMSCTGSCEIGLSALRGSEAIYPYELNNNQFASEKSYPLDFSHFSINGRVFGAKGCPENAYSASFFNADISFKFGTRSRIDLKAPIILPAMAKLNWKDYFAGAAMAGVLVVIGEDVAGKDKNLVIENGRVVSAPLIEEMVNSFREYYRGFGDIILQANYDDEHLGVLDYAISELGVKSVELKFGQAAKGIQGLGRVKTIEDALALQQKDYIVHPDPSDPAVASDYEKGLVPYFEKAGKLPIWNEEILASRIAYLRKLGAERILFKTGPFDTEDIIRILKIASANDIDLVTVDTAGGGSGNSPVKMMNEWGIPAVYQESILYDILKKMESRHYRLPAVAIAGGFAMEDHVFKGLALGAPYVRMVGIGRAAMAAALSGKKVGELIEAGTLPKEYQRFGNTKEEIFGDLPLLRKIYGERADEISTGAIGLFSYINRISDGLRQLMALNRKFALEYIDRSDIIPMTDLAARISGIDDPKKAAEKAIDMFV